MDATVKNAPGHVPGLLDYLQVFRKRKWTVLFVTAVTVGLVTLKVYSLPSIYEASTKILIDREQPKFIASEPVSSYDYYQMETQFKILYSKSIAKAAVTKLDKAGIRAFKNLGDPAASVQSCISIEPVKNSRIAFIKARHPDPKVAAALADAWAQAYIEQNLQRKLDSVRYAVDWLTDQLGTMRQKVESSELELQKFVESHQIVNIPKIEEGYTKAGLIQSLEAEKAKLDTEISELSKRYKEKHPKMIRTRSALASVEQKLLEEVATVLSLNRMKTDYGILKRDVDTNRRLYDIVLEKMKEHNLFEGLRVNNVSIIDAAEVPAYAVYPKKKRTVTIGIFMGLLLGCVLALLLESLDNTVKSIEEVQELTGLSVLGCVPDQNVLKRRLKPEQIDLACFLDSQSPFSESYRFIRTGIFFASVDKPAKVILVTSASPKEGKTSDATNLAITLASSGEKVLLIDGDLRNPRIHRVFNVSNDIGMTRILTGEVQAKDAIRETKIPNLQVLTSGPTPPNPAELLESGKMREFIQWARGNFKVIMDSPPIMAVADPIILSAIVDGVLFVVRSGSTHRKQVLQAVNKLSETQVKILGLVLNRVKGPSHGYYYPYRYAYGRKAPKQKQATLVSQS